MAVIGYPVPVLHPFPNVSQRVIQSQRVRLFLSPTGWVVPPEFSLAPRGSPLAGGSGPDRGIQQADHGFILAIDGDNPMHKKTRCLPVASGTQTPTRPSASAKIDLGGVLNRDDPPSLTLLARSPAQRLDDLNRGDRRRGQKAMRRHLPGAVTTNPAKHQRSSRNNPVKQPSTPLRSADIPKLANPLQRHHPWFSPKPPCSSMHCTDPQNLVRCVNAVARKRGRVRVGKRLGSAEKYIITLFWAMQLVPAGEPRL